MSVALLSISISPTILQANEIVTEETIIKNNANSKVGIDGGELVLNANTVIDFGVHKIENKKKEIKTEFKNNFNIIDSRGTQEGWNLTVSATPFSIVEPANGFAEGTSHYSLPLGSLNLATASNLIGVNGEKSDVMPIINNLNAAIDMGESLKVVTSDVGKGMGEYKLTFDTDALSLVIDPLTAKIDTVNYPDSVTPYESTITWDLINGPKVIE